MKKVITFLATILLTVTIMAQVPQKMSYQAIIRNSSDELIRNSNIGMQVSILQGSLTGSEVYVERHFTTSNDNGLVTIEIGDGTEVSGTFTNIDWANGPYFVKTETDLNGGANYTISGTSELLSVPYALYCLYSVPVGSIINYSGEWEFEVSGLGTGSLAGWALCNGNNGTPDLSERFIMGTSSSPSMGQTGGANSYSLSTGQLPSHTHSFTTSSAGSHSHNITVNSAGSHSHTTYNDDWTIYHALNANSGLTVFENNPSSRYFAANPTWPGNSSTGSNGSHSHSASANSNGSHSHSGTTSTIGSGNSIDNRPAFVKLAYIMKL